MSEQFDDLVFRHLAGQISAEEKAALAQQLDGDPEARRQFVRLIEEQADLAECFAATRAEDAEPARPTLRVASRSTAPSEPAQVGTVIKLTEVRPWCRWRWRRVWFWASAPRSGSGFHSAAPELRKVSRS
ncbi:MAG: hypothetical protein HC814_01500 [Rhodobacteraceae bacterium]|nr:hypothetical protein [Paracoccaceae bacterium]